MSWLSNMLKRTNPALKPLLDIDVSGVVKPLIPGDLQKVFYPNQAPTSKPVAAPTSIYSAPSHTPGRYGEGTQARRNVDAMKEEYRTTGKVTVPTSTPPNPPSGSVVKPLSQLPSVTSTPISVNVSTPSPSPAPTSIFPLPGVSTPPPLFNPAQIGRVGPQSLAFEGNVRDWVQNPIKQAYRTVTGSKNMQQRAPIRPILDLASANVGYRVTSRMIYKSMKQYGIEQAGAIYGLGVNALNIIFQHASRRGRTRFTSRDRRRGRSYINFLCRNAAELKSLTGRTTVTRRKRRC